jgi:hypothetical protein
VKSTEEGGSYGACVMCGLESIYAEMTGLIVYRDVHFWIIGSCRSVFRPLGFYFAVTPDVDSPGQNGKKQNFFSYHLPSP